ncbi:MAG: TRAP transporter small permease subunit [Kofleriaceae bacterium]
MSEDAGGAPAAAPAPEVAWVPTYPRIRRLDAAWARGERLLCGLLFLAMAVLMITAVIAETFGQRREVIDVVALYGVCLLAVRTRAIKGTERRLGWPASAGVAAVLAAAIAGGVVLYTERLPGGLPQAQPLALVMMLWVGLLGASIAAHERAHLALEFGEKLWPARLAPYVKAAAHGVTSAFCVAGMILAAHLVATTRGTVDVNDWLPVAYVMVILPYMFAAMAVRFLAQAVTTATGTAAPAEEQLPT